MFAAGTVNACLAAGTVAVDAMRQRRAEPPGRRPLCAAVRIAALSVPSGSRGRPIYD